MVEWFQRTLFSSFFFSWPHYLPPQWDLASVVICTLFLYHWFIYSPIFDFVCFWDSFIRSFVFLYPHSLQLVICYLDDSFVFLPQGTVSPLIVNTNATFFAPMSREPRWCCKAWKPFWRIEKGSMSFKCCTSTNRSFMGIPISDPQLKEVFNSSSRIPWLICSLRTL